MKTSATEHDEEQMKPFMRSTAGLVSAFVLLNSAFVPSVSARPARHIDPCLVGNWTLKKMWFRPHGPGLSEAVKRAETTAGLSGAKMTILRNGYTTVVLTGSTPYIGPYISQRLVGTQTFYIDASRKHPQGGDWLLPDRFHADYGYSDILSPIHTGIVDTRTVDYGFAATTRTYRIKDFFDTFSYTCTASTLMMDLGYNSPTSTWTSDHLAIWYRGGP